MLKTIATTTLLCATLTLSQTTHANDTQTNYWDNHKKITQIDFRQIKLRAAVRFLTDVTGITIIPSEKLQNKTVTIYLKNSSLQNAIEAICRAGGMFPKFDQKANTIYLLTSEEISKSIDYFSDDKTETIQLLYPRVIDIAEAIQALYQDRVIFMRPRHDNDKNEELEEILERMDLLEERSVFENQNQNSNQNSNQSSNNSRNSRNSNNNTRNTRNTRSSNNQNNQSSRIDSETKDIEQDLATNKGGFLNRVLHTKGQVNALQLQRKPARIYIAAMQHSNTLLIRSADPKAVRMILNVVRKLDRPTAQVLLEAKVLEITVDDSDKRGVDWLFASESGHTSASQSTGQIGLPNPTNLLPTGSGFDSRAAVFSHISSKFRVRLQMLETQGRITKLATPTLLVTDNEASKVFVGTNAKFLESVERAATVTAENGTVAAGSGGLTPILGERHIGTSLLITPKIHADNTVTLRILQEYSDFGRAREIDYGGTSTVKVQDIQQQLITTTVVAGNGHMLVVGGLIKEGVEDNINAIPYLSNIPLLGNLFKHSTKTRTRKELILLIRPYILLAPGKHKELFGDYIKRISQHPSASKEMPALNVTEPKDLATPLTKSTLKNNTWYNKLTKQLKVWSVDHQ